MPNPSTVTTCDFGEELRRLRKRAGLTLRSLAKRVAFDYSYLAQVERGARPGSATLAYRCDQALGAHGHLIRLYTDRKMRQLMHEATAMPNRPTGHNQSDRAGSVRRPNTSTNQ